MSSLRKLHLQVGQLDTVWLRNELGPQGSQVKLSLWLRPLVSGQRAEVVFVCPHGHHRARGWMFLGLLSTDKASLLTSDRLCPALCEIMSFCFNSLPQFPAFWWMMQYVQTEKFQSHFPQIVFFFFFFDSLSPEMFYDKLMNIIPPFALCIAFVLFFCQCKHSNS